jgi:hypothetical protein
MTRASYPESARAMALGARPMAGICAAEWPALSPPLTARVNRAELDSRARSELELRKQAGEEPDHDERKRWFGLSEQVPGTIDNRKF